MAQWKGQYSGPSHETKVIDIEASLRRSIAARGESTTNESLREDPLILGLAERLFMARRKALRARLSTLTEPGISGEEERELPGAQEKLKVLDSGGVDAILEEFVAI